MIYWYHSLIKKAAVWARASVVQSTDNVDFTLSGSRKQWLQCQCLFSSCVSKGSNKVTEVYRSRGHCLLQLNLEAQNKHWAQCYEQGQTIKSFFIKLLVVMRCWMFSSFSELSSRERVYITAVLQLRLLDALRAQIFYETRILLKPMAGSIVVVTCCISMNSSVSWWICCSTSLGMFANSTLSRKTTFNFAKSPKHRFIGAPVWDLCLSI